MSFQGFVSKRALVLAVISGLFFVGSSVFASPLCETQGISFEGEVVSKYRVEGQIQERSEIESLPKKWSINQPFYSHIHLRTKSSKLNTKNFRVYTQIGKKISGPFELEKLKAVSGGARLRVQDLLFRKIADNAREMKTGRVEFSVRDGDEILCVYPITVRGGD